MIIKIDASQLEWRTYVELAQDIVAYSELLENRDIHAENQKKFNLPSRLISKKFLFRWIYRGPAYAYAKDHEFSPISSKEKFWQNVINKANEKYIGIYKYQDQLIQKAKNKEIITIPTGRSYSFDISYNKKNEPYWDINKIVNWPNQGFGADIVALARVELFDILSSYKKQEKIKFCNTVHDDIIIDVDNDYELMYNICVESLNVFSNIGSYFRKAFGVPLVTPFKSEVYFGTNMLDFTQFDITKKEDQFRL
jgi:DNA polymerase I-like protein with 3'-5' exonuclease and polymerase domains